MFEAGQSLHICPALSDLFVWSTDEQSNAEAHRQAIRHADRQTDSLVWTKTHTQLVQPCCLHMMSITALGHNRLL